jgi:hypothetical protein
MSTLYDYFPAHSQSKEAPCRLTPRFPRPRSPETRSRQRQYILNLVSIISIASCVIRRHARARHQRPSARVSLNIPCLCLQMKILLMMMRRLRNRQTVHFLGFDGFRNDNEQEDEIENENVRLNSFSKNSFLPIVDLIRKNSWNHPRPPTVSTQERFQSPRIASCVFSHSRVHSLG